MIPVACTGVFIFEKAVTSSKLYGLISVMRLLPVVGSTLEHAVILVLVVQGAKSRGVCCCRYGGHNVSLDQVLRSMTSTTI